MCRMSDRHKRLEKKGLVFVWDGGTSDAALVRRVWGNIRENVAMNQGKVLSSTSVIAALAVGRSNLKQQTIDSRDMWYPLLGLMTLLLPLT